MAVHETRPGDRPPSAEPSGWALGVIGFAATMMFLIGIFQALAGLVAIFDDELYVVTRNYTFDIDVSAWGWIHLIVGLAVFATGIGLFMRQTWAGVTGIFRDRADRGDRRANSRCSRARRRSACSAGTSPSAM